MQKVDSLGKTLMLGKTEGRRRRGRQKMKWLDGITDSMDMLLLLLLNRFCYVQLCNPIDGSQPGYAIPWISRRSNQSILKEINPEYSLEGLILKLKL